METIYGMTVSELMTWQEYIDLYGFERDREDFKAAQLCFVLNLMAQGKYLVDVTLKDFLPDYLNTVSLEKTEEQKLADERRYVEMLVSTGFAVMEIKQ